MDGIRWGYYQVDPVFFAPLTLNKERSMQHMVLRVMRKPIRHPLRTTDFYIPFGSARGSINITVSGHVCLERAFPLTRLAA